MNTSHEPDEDYIASLRAAYRGDEDEQAFRIRPATPDSTVPRGVVVHSALRARRVLAASVLGAAAAVIAIALIAANTGDAPSDPSDDRAARPGATNEPTSSAATQSSPDATPEREPDAALNSNAKNAVRTQEVDAADPRFPISNPESFAVVALGKVVAFRAGPAQGAFPGDPDPIGTVIVELEVLEPVAGKVGLGDPLFVRLAIEDLDGLRAAVPTGTRMVVAANPVDTSLDRFLDDPQAGVPDDAVRYVAGAPYAAIADGSRTWLPLLSETFEHPLEDLIRE